jgi:hypothetical protein
MVEERSSSAAFVSVMSYDPDIPSCELFARGLSTGAVDMTCEMAGVRRR